MQENAVSLAKTNQVLTLRINCISGIAELEKLCQKNGVRLSQACNGQLVRLVLQKLGPLKSQNLISRLVERGDISWGDDEDFEVESIHGSCTGDDGQPYYLIKWRGWTSRYNTWEPEANLNCPHIIATYKAKGAVRGRKRKRQDVEDDNITTSKQEILDEMYRKIVKNCQFLTPYKLLGLDQKLTDIELKRYREKGLLANANDDAPRQIRKSGILASKKTKSYRQMKEETQKAIKDWEDLINSINTDPARIVVENKCDLEGPPAGFTYISDYIAGNGIVMPTDPLVGCDCEDCHERRACCCPANMGSANPYTKRKKVRVPPGTPLYECNKRCQCDESCPNRVVQLGRKAKLAIFRTSNSRGWGVKTLQKILKGSFVMEYVGEVITSEEAETRGEKYDAEGMTYLFDLDFNDGDNPYTVDARNFGNVSHFVNHSCEPNLAVYGVWINNLEPSLPRIALFSMRDIRPGEELTFDYMMKIDHYHQTGSQLSTPIKSGEQHEDDDDLARPIDENDNSVIVESFVDNVKSLVSQLVDSIVRGLPVGSDNVASTPVKRNCTEINYDDLINVDACSELLGKDLSNDVRQNGFHVPEEEQSVNSTLHPGGYSNCLASAITNDVGKELTSTPVPSRVAPIVLTSPGRRLFSPHKNQMKRLRSPSRAKNRIVCQCGTTKCRGFLF